MTRLFWMLMGIAVGAGLAYYSSQNYLIHAANGYEFVPRSSTGFNDAYLDTRHFTFSDWAAHPALAADIAKAGKMHILTGGAPAGPSMLNAPQMNTQQPVQRAW